MTLITPLQITRGLPDTYAYSSNELRNIQRAWSAARLSTERQKHGAVVMLGAKVVATGTNTFRNDPLVLTNPAVEASFHAERNAIMQLSMAQCASGKLRMYVVRINNSGLLMPSKPCLLCGFLANNYNIKAVYHS